MLALWLLVFITGLAVGSFLNVCIYRLPLGQSLVTPPSHCPKCNHRLGAGELVPVLSYLMLRGKCRCCGARISPRYPVVELATGLAFVLLVMVFGWQIKTLGYLILFCGLLTASLIDWDHQIIPDQISLLLVGAGLILQALQSTGTLINGIIGGLLGGGLLLVLAVLSKGGMGGGDIKLVTGIGVFLGWQLLLVSLFLSFIIGSLLSGIWILIKRQGLKTAVPFGPFLSLGAIITLFYGEQILNWYLNCF
ncbi:Prepilin peptidase [Desulfotomaculum nigrificans CO-1-SRB]|uniref:Prepilin leader peptidase/N-methyltransferase n=1 Tax=Desulfotomaculum nigrificans (strain DSM 14880 / VKM B-2319 / CO-1-SRB) TaxID=868595 RepID=F6BA54_DESCC|nr:A24 family peptidase [Desulfotomaculum nigrificans]AEF95023.1 Prepilin peptidase [Desulfotomaculum nigrificans CO-1-SRB]